MRYTRDIDGLTRMQKSRTYKDVRRKMGYYSTPLTVKKSEESEDTKIRRDIYKTIKYMMGQEKSDVEIEIFLTNKYPTYGAYIRQLIIDQFKKFNLPKSIEAKDGEER